MGAPWGETLYAYVQTEHALRDVVLSPDATVREKAVQTLIRHRRDADTDKLVRAYQGARDASEQARLAAVYARITDASIQQRMRRLSD